MEFRFDNTFKLPATALYWNLGHPSLPLSPLWAAKMFCFYIMFTPTFISLLYSNIYDDFSKICINTSLSFLYCIITVNYILLVIYKNRFNDMIRTVEKDLNRSRKLIAEDEKVVKEYIVKGKQASIILSSVCISCGCMFFCKAVLGTSYSVIVGNFKPVHVHEIRYPTGIEEKKNTFSGYIVIFGLHTFYIICTNLMYTGFNSLGSIFLMHACGQIKLATREVERVFGAEDMDVKGTEMTLKNIARSIQNIYSFVGQIQHTHRLFYEMCLKTSTIVIPVACFGIIESYKEGSINIELMCYVFGFFLQCGIPCYYCEVLLNKGEELRLAVYESGWERFWAPKTRSMVLLILSSTTRPLGIRSVFCTVSLEAYADVMNQAYKIFSVMNAAWSRNT